ncbi:TetR family transcriptional regulator [Frankia sp. CcI49]|uniref:TetR/AcrR family transcriptional regulator n=1 Tax=unclassified Frankia TaxID=2632575 RepID=UPI0006C9FFB5|nr:MULTISPECIES: TetR/AcrR family transcriptional regulator [unclassified Frankia]KPM52622.1 TetR family transcriptional regulator [Frankia sp. R43]ONH60070.1 TetR family transcriptional regulator [Frankia sp. CcI49]
MTSEAELSYRARRDEQREDSRNRILDAAVDCLIEGGYASATTPRIQARAGISRGGLLHHFPSRDALLVAASEHLARRRIASTAATAEQIARTHPAGPQRLTRMVELLWTTFHEPHWWAALELWTAARTHDEIAVALRPVERHLGAIVRDGVDAMFGPDYTGHPRYPQVRELLVSSMRGLALTYTFDQRDPIHDPHLAMWKDLVMVMLHDHDEVLDNDEVLDPVGARGGARDRQAETPATE